LPGTSPVYRGRFAPSPTGPLHLGSLIAALASYLDAKHRGGSWLVRMEDLDPPREEPGAADRILQGLLDHGLQWDEDVLWQSKRHPAYLEALAQLETGNCLFRCDCTRARLGPGGACAGHCQPRQAEVPGPFALRVAVPAGTQVTFTDLLQGRIQENLGSTLPDFVLLRKDGLFAYQLAVVVDDAYQEISHVVRGSDLLDSTARQIYLQQLLGLPVPSYCHIPVITNDDGQKLSKQNHAPPLKSSRAADNLRLALSFLHQAPAPSRARTTADILAFATGNWDQGAVPAQMTAPASGLGS
jgi:glutamyl-Q tRNA(Asp) synthetase